MTTVMRFKSSTSLRHLIRKTIICSLIFFACLVFIVLARPVEAREKAFNVHLNPTLNSIKITWPEKKAAVKNRIYRADGADSAYMELGLRQTGKRSQKKPKVKAILRKEG